MLVESRFLPDFPPVPPQGFADYATEIPLNQSRNLYFALADHHIPPHTLQEARLFLEEQLRKSAAFSSDLPMDSKDLLRWIEAHTAKVGQEYRKYLQQREAGEPRRYFSSKSHALNFLQSVAPTKLVDGAWLYGLVNQWSDGRFAKLISIYLEELGGGMPDKNHVLLYRKLLATYGCDHWQNLSDAHFTQGALQLSLAHNADQFLPEVIGFNLGYEQLPLHLLITAFELNELDIDPYYFTLHITVDNAASGHAKKSIEGLFDAMPLLANSEDFYRRVMNGYQLNMLGASTTSVIADFNLEDELVRVLTAKADTGQHAHSNFCRINGRSVNQWLASGDISDFLQALQQKGWIKRHHNPIESRFWQLLEGGKAEMFGVFSAYEKQVIYDWIAGDWITQQASLAATPRPLTYKVRQRLFSNGAPHSSETVSNCYDDDSEFNVDTHLLQQKLAALTNKQQIMHCLTGMMSPACHYTSAGLMATRIFCDMLHK